MNFSYFVALAVGLNLMLALNSGCDAAAAHKPAASNPPADAGVAVVELFTSEGCSSCPSADDRLAELVKDARLKSRPIYALAFHVDYWNNLGWVDRFASPEFTQRQQRYSLQFGANQIYTPQMVVNGATQFVGSDRRAAADAIVAALRQPAAVQITLNAAVQGKAVDVSYRLDRAPAGAVINIALVEDGLATQVPRGENGGRTLRHEHVVRAFASLAAEAAAAQPIRLTPPQNVDMAKASVVAYVQEARSLRVLGAAAVDQKSLGKPGPAAAAGQ